MNKFIACLAAIVFLASAASAVTKTPALSGATGLVKMPTGDVLNSRDFNVGLDYFFDNSNSGSAPAPGGNDPRGTWSYKMNIGAYGSKTQGFEMGFIGRTERTTSRIKEGVFINLKYSLSGSDDPEDLRLAIGLENLTSNTETDAYMVATKYFRGGAGLHFGAMFDFPDSKFRPLGMIGLGIPVGSPQLTLMTEAFGGESMFQANAGLRMSFNSTFSLLVRALNVTGSSTSKDVSSFSLGFSASNFL